MKIKLIILLFITLVFLIASIIYMFIINQKTDIYTMILVITSLILTSFSLVITIRKNNN